MARKPRSDSKIMSLPQPVQDQIADWLTVANQSYEQVRQRCAQELGVTTSVGALQHFYGVYAAPRKYAQASDAADAFASLMQGRFDEATIKKAQELAFDAINSPAPDVKTAKTLVKIVGDSAKLELQRRKLALDEQRFREQLKTDIEHGLDALHAEIKGNAEALQLFERLKAAVLRSVEAAN